MEDARNYRKGHGQFSTVWLAQDSSTRTYVSLKVLAADAKGWPGSPNRVWEELENLSRLRNSVEQVGKEYVVRLIDDFIHVGPNGEHHCIVTELLGPSMSSDIEELYPTEIFPPAISRSINRQVAYAVWFLHRNNIVHGDLHFGNILFTSPKLSALRPDDIPLYYGEVTKYAVYHPVDGVERPPHAPLYIVHTPDPTPLLHLCLSNPDDVRIKICDFSESSFINTSTRPKTINMPYVYRAPEVVLKKPTVPTFSAEIWTLAVHFHRASTGGSPIFQAGGLSLSEDELLKNIVLQLGKLPETLWSAWDQRAEYFDEEGRSLNKPTEGTCCFRYRNDLICEDERVLFERMAQTMIVLDAEKRITIDEVVKSEWFIKYCQGSIVLAGS